MGRVIVIDDATDENVVIAPIDDFLHAAIEPGDDVREDRAAGNARRPVDAGEAIGPWRTEGGGDGLLILRENVDGEVAGPHEGRGRTDRIGNAHQHQGRGQGYRRE